MIGAGNRCECFYASLSDDIFLNKDQKYYIWSSSNEYKVKYRAKTESQLDVI